MNHPPHDREFPSRPYRDIAIRCNSIHLNPGIFPKILKYAWVLSTWAEISISLMLTEVPPCFSENGFFNLVGVIHELLPHANKTIGSTPFLLYLISYRKLCVSTKVRNSYSTIQIFTDPVSTLLLASYIALSALAINAFAASAKSVLLSQCLLFSETFHALNISGTLLPRSPSLSALQAQPHQYPLFEAI